MPSPLLLVPKALEWRFPEATGSTSSGATCPSKPVSRSHPAIPLNINISHVHPGGPSPGPNPFGLSVCLCEAVYDCVVGSDRGSAGA